MNYYGIKGNGGKRKDINRRFRESVTPEVNEQEGKRVSVRKRQKKERVRGGDGKCIR